LYASSKFIHQLVSDSDNAIFLGGNIGLQKHLGSKFSILAEGSNFFIFDNKFKTTSEVIYQAGIGVVFHLK